LASEKHDSRKAKGDDLTMATILNTKDWETAVDYLAWNLSDYGVSRDEIMSFLKGEKEDDYRNAPEGWDFAALLGEAQSYFSHTLEDHNYFDD
jgi:hypothetical protein